MGVSLTFVFFLCCFCIGVGVLFLLPQVEFFFPFSFTWGFYYLLISCNVEYGSEDENDKGCHANK